MGVSRANGWLCMVCEVKGLGLHTDPDDLTPFCQPLNNLMGLHN